MRDSQAKLVLFEQLRRGPLTEVEASLFPARLRADIIREGIARRLDDGGLERVNTSTYSATGPTVATLPQAQPPADPMPTLSARITHEDMAFIDSLGMTRADALRFILERARLMGTRFIGSGQHRKASG